MLTLVLLSLAVSADDVADGIIKQATQVRLDKFLEQFVGECNKGEAEDKLACKENADKFRKESKDKSFVTELPTNIARNLRPVETKSREFYAYNFTPFFDGNGYGLTFGKPTSQDKEGNPRVKPAILNIPSNDVGESIFNGIKVDRITISLVFKPGEVWKLPLKKKGEFIYGVGVKPVLLRMEDPRCDPACKADTVF